MSDYTWWVENIMDKTKEKPNSVRHDLPGELRGSHISLRFNAPVKDVVEYIHEVVSGKRHWFTTTEAEQPDILRQVKSALPNFHVVKHGEYLTGISNEIYANVHQPPVLHQFTNAPGAVWRNVFVSETTWGITGGRILRLFAGHYPTHSSEPNKVSVEGFTDLGRRIARNANKPGWVQVAGLDTNRDLHNASQMQAISHEMQATCIWKGKEPKTGSHHGWKDGKANGPNTDLIDGMWVTGAHVISASVEEWANRPLTLDHVAIGTTVKI